MVISIERDSSLLILEEFSFLNLQCPPRISARLSSSAFPTSHPFIRSLPILNGMMGYDYLQEKVYLQSVCPSFQEYAFPQGS